MLENYTPEQQRAVEEKVELFRNTKESGSDCDELHRIRSEIYRKRTKWIEDNFEQMRKKLAKYKAPVERVFRLIFFEYMKIDPKDVEAEFFPKRRNAKAVFIRSKNFCPYLEAFKKLGLDSTEYCKMTLEESVGYLANLFLSKEGVPYGVWFERNYDDHNDLIGLGPSGAGIRPYTRECQEYFIDRSLQFSSHFGFEAYREMFRSNFKLNYDEARKLVSLDF